MSLPWKLSLMVGAVAALLISVALFLVFFFPSRTNEMGSRWAQRRGDAVASLLSTAVAPGLDFDDAASVEENLRGLHEVAGAVYGILRVGNNVMAAWQPDKVPDLAKVPGLQAQPPLAKNSMLHFFRKVTSRAGNDGLLVLGFSLAELAAEHSRNRFVGAVVGLVVLLLGVGISIAMVTVLLRPITQLARATANVVKTGDLTASFEALSGDAFGTLSRSVGEIVHQQRQILGRLKGLIDGVGDVVGRVSTAGTAVSRGSNAIQAKVEETASATEEMLTSLRNIAHDVDRLNSNAEDSTSSLVQMHASNTEVAGNIKTMAEAVRETGGAMNAIGSSISEIARNIERLDNIIRDTASSMQQMNGAIGDVERNAKHTSQLAERVATDALSGVEALQKTLRGIHNIRETVLGSADVIDRLGDRIVAIGDILSVIDDVANQTKLLSLNAAIIAAQAGEHGRGFSVVADQIKELAARTGVSTQKIAKLIHNIQNESEEAISTMRRGVRSVEEGVELGQGATQALETILHSTEDARSMIHKIAEATVHQARGSKQITTALRQISEMVQEINRYSREQANTAHQVVDSTHNMNMLTEQVRNSSDEQAHGSRRVIKSIETITGMLTRVNNAQKSQTGAAELVLVAVDSIRGISEQQANAVAELEAAITSLGEEAVALEDEVSKFKL